MAKLIYVYTQLLYELFYARDYLCFKNYFEYSIFLKKIRFLKYLLYIWITVYDNFFKPNQTILLVTTYLSLKVMR